MDIDWGTKVINVYKSDPFMTLVQVTPTVIYDCNLNSFRLGLKDIEDSDEGIVFERTHKHNTEVSLGGLTFARIIEILPPYTVTFENEQYAVNLTGANSNVGDRINVNQVSVRSQNSAGMTSSPTIEHGSFNDRVTIDPVNGSNGTLFPIGTSLKPVSNLQDAILIAEYRGIKKILTLGDLTVDTEDLSNYTIAAVNAIQATIYLDDIAILHDVEIIEATVHGTLDGNTILRNCIVDRVNYFTGIIYNSAITEEPVRLGGSSTAMLLHCMSAVAGGNSRPQIDFDNQPTSLLVRGWQGGIEIVNKTTDIGEVSIDMDSGIVYIRASCTAGEITVRGVGTVIDESGPGCTVKDITLSSDRIANGVWEQEDAAKLLEDTLGKAEVSSDSLHVTIRKRSDDSVSHKFDISADKKMRTPV